MRSRRRIPSCPTEELARQALANIPHDDPSLRNQTIFYKGRKDGSPFRSYSTAARYIPLLYRVAAK